MREALPREVRTGGGTEPAWIGDVDRAGNAELRFSRAGPEFAIEAGSAGQRIGYRLRDGAIEVLYWPRLDQPASVASRRMRWPTASRNFASPISIPAGPGATRWPAHGEPAVPRAVRVALTLAGGESVERWLALR